MWTSSQEVNVVRKFSFVFLLLSTLLLGGCHGMIVETPVGPMVIHESSWMHCLECEAVYGSQYNYLHRHHRVVPWQWYATTYPTYIPRYYRGIYRTVPPPRRGGGRRWTERPRHTPPRGRRTAEPRRAVPRQPPEDRRGVRRAPERRPPEDRRGVRRAPERRPPEDRRGARRAPERRPTVQSATPTEGRRRAVRRPPEQRPASSRPRREREGRRRQ